MMETRRILVIASLVLVSLIITTGVILAQAIGAVNQGTNSTVEGDFSTVSGGSNNNIPADGDFATIGGGEDNTASGRFSTIGGGAANTASNLSSTVGGGAANTASGSDSSVAGGFNNKAIDVRSTVGGGNSNTASGFSSTIAGGEVNTASGFRSTVGGGAVNKAIGDHSTIPGGLVNTAAGNFSFAAGRRAQANHSGTFVWADSTDEDFASTGQNQFLIRASGGVGIGTNRPNQLLVVGDDLGDSLPGSRVTIGNTGTPGPNGRSGLNLGEDQDQRAFILWHNDENYLQLGVKNGNIQENDALVIKDRTVGVGTATPTERLHVNGNVLADDFLTASSLRWKTNIQTIEGALEKVQGLRGVSYDRKETGEHQIGLIAEEVGAVIPEVVVYEENGVDAKAVDYARLVPILVEAVKEQQELLEDKDSQIAALQADNHEFEARIAALEESVEAKGTQRGTHTFSTSLMWMMIGSLGLLLVTPGLALGYRRIRRDE
jgi:hypothetical protein